MFDVSIIIPVYNTEQYISRCLDTILCQTVKNIEIIIIDDGSKDGSLKIIQEYQCKYPEIIKCFSQENAGQGAARNAGVTHATGKYVSFIDSDDYIDKDFIETLFTIAQENAADIVMSGLRRFTDGGKVLFERPQKVDGEFSKFLLASACTKLYKRTFFMGCNLKFIPNCNAEDLVLNWVAQSYPCKTVATKYVGYNYYFNPKSLTNTKYLGYNEKSRCFSVLDITRNSINHENSVADFEVFDYFCIRFVIYYLLRGMNYSTKKSFYSELNFSLDWFAQNGINYNKNTYMKRHPDGEELKFWLVIKIFFFFKKLHLFNLLRLAMKMVKITW